MNHRLEPRRKHRTRVGLLPAMVAGAVLGVMACGPSATPERSDDGEPSTVPSEATKPADKADEGKAEAAAASPECTRACTPWKTCTNETHEQDCLRDCEDNLLPKGADVVTRYAECLEGLSCEQLSESLEMNLGPAGACQTS